MAQREGARSINRRVFLRAAGAATGAAVVGGIPAIVAAQKAPSFPKGTKLNILEWVSFVPASDVEFKRLALYALVFLASPQQKTIPIGVFTELVRGDVFYWGPLMAALRDRAHGRGEGLIPRGTQRASAAREGG